jgi:effector-binding domain-containing protein
MSDILEKQELRMTHVLSLRKRAAAQDFQREIASLDRFIAENALVRTGTTVSATFAAEIENGAQVLDMEVLIPLDKSFEPPDGCAYKPEFLLTNAVKARHIGNPTLMQAVAAEINSYIQEHKLTPITAGYNVTVVEPKSQAELDNMVVDIYVGVSPNIL